jgi:hypothetical protein
VAAEAAGRRRALQKKLRKRHEEGPERFSHRFQFWGARAHIINRMAVMQMHAITVASAVSIATAPFMRYLMVRNSELSIQAPQSAVSGSPARNSTSPYRRRVSMAPIRAEGNTVMP